MMLELSTIRAIVKRLTAPLRKDHVIYNGTFLPPKQFRFCGGEFKDDSYFLMTARREGERLIKFCGLNIKSHVLDIGCGPGRLPIGILSCVGEIESYHGIDVDKESINWCQRHISRRHATFQFSHIDVQNNRYNPKGKTTGSNFRFPFNDSEFDIIYLYSVFSHMVEEEVGAYLREIGRVVKPKGKVFLTGFFEKGVPRVSVNPSGYRMDWKGDLHCVRYNQECFEGLLAENDLYIELLEYQGETNGQTALYVVRENVYPTEVSRGEV